MVKLYVFLSLFFLAFISCNQQNKTMDSGKVLPFVTDGKWGYIDIKTDSIVITPQFDWAERFSEGLAAVKMDHMWFYIDRTGKKVLEPKHRYDRVWDFSEGLAVVYDGFALGYIDKTGKEVIKPRFFLARKFSQGLAAVLTDEPTEGCADTSSYIILGVFFNFLFDRSKWRYINKTGQMAFDKCLRFNFAGTFSEGLAPVIHDLKFCYIDKKGHLVLPTPQLCHRDDISQSLTPGVVPTGRGYVYFDLLTGQVITTDTVELDDARDFSEGLAAVKVGEKWGFISPTGNMAINPQFDEVSDFSEGVTQVRIDDKWGYIDKTGNYVVNPTR